MKTFRVKAFYGDVLAEDCPEVNVVARDSECAIFSAMCSSFREFALKHYDSFEFIEAVEI